MPSNSRKKIVTIVKPASAVRTHTTIVTSNNHIKTHKSTNKRPKKISWNHRTGFSPALQAYYSCMARPFDCPPIRVGFGCLVPTALHTAYLRGSAGANATDGSFDFVVTNFLNATLLFNNSGGANTPSWTVIGSANASVISGQIDMARVVGAAIRIFPQVALTAPPGILSSGISPRCDISDFVTFCSQTTNTRQNLPYNQFFQSRTGDTECNEVCWRPTDVKDFEFSDLSAASFFGTAGGIISANSATSNVGSGSLDSGGSFLHISGTGLPASCNIFYEIVLHLECTDTINSIVNDSGADSSPSLCQDQSIGSVESAFRTLSKYLPSPSSAITAAGYLARSQVGQAAMAYGKHRIQRMIQPMNNDGFVMVV